MEDRNLRSMPSQVSTTEVDGIFQGDIILRTALVAAIQDIRANPWLLDYVFASLAKDSLSRPSYGEKEIAAAKRWFLKTNVPIVMVPRIDEAKVPCISIRLVSSDESEVTLGDIHYQPTEDNSWDWPALAGPFSPSTYNPTTGMMTFPVSVTSNIVVAPNMILVDSVGGQHPILDVDDAGNIIIEAGTIADFSKALLKGQPPVFVTDIESVRYRETYQIGVHVSSEPVYLSWLHAVVVFILFRYKQEFLEARGLAQTVFGSTDFERNEINEGENVFSRYVNLTGYVRQSWPKLVSEKIAVTVTQPIQIIGAGHLPPDVDPETQIWTGDEDMLTFPPK